MIESRDASAIPERKTELKAFLFLTALLAPLLSVLLVGGLGFAIWIYQMIAGPPTH